MNSSRTSRRIILALAHAAPALLSVALASGCYDTFHPNRAEVKVRFAGDPESLVKGARLLVDGQVVIDSVTTSEWNAILDQGPHIFQLQKGCVDVEPADSVTVTLLGGHPATIDFRCVLRCGLLTLNFHPQVPGLERGTRIYLDGALVEDSLEASPFDLLLEPGTHTLRYRAVDPCTTFDPDSQTIEIAPRETPTADVNVAATAGILSIESTPSGLPLTLDDVPSGTTPALIRCIEGHHEVEVSPPPSLGFSIQGDSIKGVDVPTGGSAELSFPFTYAPLPQSRGVLLELFTATYCPNCPPADYAVDEIENDPTFESEAFSGVEVHLKWGGTDPWYTDAINALRMLYYGGDFSSAPIAFFNGLDKTTGSAGDIRDIYMGKVQQTYGQEGKAALYWRNVAGAGDLLRGDLRFVAVTDLSGYDSPKLYAFYAKDSLRAASDPFGVGYYQGVAREYIAPVDLRSLRVPGSYLDVPVSFDLSEDSAYPAHSLKLVSFVQDSTTQEIIQVREARIRIP